MSLKTLTKNQIKSVVYIAGLLLIFFLIGQAIDLEFLNSHIERAGMWAPTLYILTKISTVVFAPLSGTSLYIIAGPLFGLGWGIVYTIIGDMIGYSILFYIGRKYGLRVIGRIAGEGTVETVRVIVGKISDVKTFVKTSFAFFWFPEGVTIAISLGDFKYKKFIGILFLLDILASVTVISISTFILM
jgi:uncharacterized membrane protein YdjX (TVP38/TMEM64 family)